MPERTLGRGPDLHARLRTQRRAAVPATLLRCRVFATVGAAGLLVPGEIRCRPTGRSGSLAPVVQELRDEQPHQHRLTGTGAHPRSMRLSLCARFNEASMLRGMSTMRQIASLGEEEATAVAVELDDLGRLSLERVLNAAIRAQQAPFRWACACGRRPVKRARPGIGRGRLDVLRIAIVSQSGGL